MANRFDLVDLQLFLHIAEAASITHGARRSNMSLAAASERVRAMEDAFGARLLDRKRRGVELTPAGSVLLHHAYPVVQQLEQMRGELARFAKGLRGRIRVLTSTVGMFEHLPAALSDFLSTHPHVDVDLEERRKVEIIRDVAAGRADIALIPGELDPAIQFETFPFAQNRVVLVVPQGHPLDQAHTTTFAQALDFEFVGLDASRGLQALADEQAQLLGRQVKVRVRLSSLDVVCQMVGNGIGVAIVQEAAGHRWSQIAPIRVVEISDSWTARHLWVGVKSFKSLSPHAQGLVELLRTRAIPWDARRRGN
jgi:molybdate transport repressor ModE-like protein